MHIIRLACFVPWPHEREHGGSSKDLAKTSILSWPTTSLSPLLAPSTKYLKLNISSASEILVNSVVAKGIASARELEMTGRQVSYIDRPALSPIRTSGVKIPRYDVHRIPDPEHFAELNAN